MIAEVNSWGHKFVVQSPHQIPADNPSEYKTADKDNGEGVP